jgi:hypothetical protein
MTSATYAESVYFVSPGTLLGYLFTAAALAAERAGAETPRELQGAWIGEVGGRQVLLELRSTGTYVLAGVEGSWSARDGWLELDDEPLAYRLAGGVLDLTDPAGQTVRWARTAR